MINISEQVYELDGNRMKTKDSLFDEFINKFRFPDYFGRNWDAFYDCLQNMLLKDDITIIIRNSEAILDNETDIDTFIRIMVSIEKFWNSDIGHEEKSGHKNRKLALIFHFSEKKSLLEQKLQSIIYEK